MPLMASPTYSDEAVITLTVLDPPSSMSFPNRRILLSKWRSAMPIGRTSKRNSNYEAAENNAWIDSAVMSRDHAELRIDTQQQQVILRDIGSLHGTFCNNTRLGQNQGHILQTGDVIQFGIPIDRGHDTFPPCSIRAAVEFGASSPDERPTVFTVPEETDVEDMSSDEDEDEDEDVQHSSRILEHNQIRPARLDSTSGIPNASTNNIFIDLTSNDKIVQQVDISPVNSREPSTSQAHHEMIDIDQPNSPASSVAESELPGSRIPTPPETVEISEGEEEEEDLVSSPESYAEDDETDVEEENYPIIEGQEMTNDDPWSADHTLTASAALQSALGAAHTPAPYLMGEDVRTSYRPIDLHGPDSYLGTSRLPPIRGFPESIALSGHLPSLSEALPTPTSPPKSRSLADIMGARSGTHEYWEARELNRSNFIVAPPPMPVPLGLSFRADEPENRVEMTLHMSEDQPMSTEELPIDLAGMGREAHSYSADRMDVTSSGAEFLLAGPPLEVNMIPREPDDTSAYQYEITSKAIEAEKSKNAQAEELNKTIDKEISQRKAAQEERLAQVKDKLIKTGLEPSPAPQTENRSNKRKASDISDTTTEEEEAAAEPVSMELTSAEPTIYQPTVAQPHASSAGYDDARSPKRFRRVAEAFGYAALGGVAVMSALIATAPTL